MNLCLKDNGSACIVWTCGVTCCAAVCAVLYHGSICRLIGNLLAYGVSPEEKMGSRFRLRQELDLMKQEYNTLL